MVFIRISTELFFNIVVNEFTNILTPDFTWLFGEFENICFTHGFGNGKVEEFNFWQVLIIYVERVLGIWYWGEISECVFETSERDTERWREVCQRLRRLFTIDEHAENSACGIIRT